MTVLEITILEYISPPTPELTTKVLSALKKVRSNLAAEIYPTHSRFFSPIDGQSRVYIFGSWPSLEAHREFLENDELRERVLKDQEGLMKWVAGGHVQMNGNGSEKGGMTSESLPLDAPVIGIAMIPGYLLSSDAYEGYIKHQFVDQVPIAKENGWTDFRGSRCDIPEGENEEVLLVGWREDEVPPAVRQGLLDAIHFELLKDLERSAS